VTYVARTAAHATGNSGPVARHIAVDEPVIRRLRDRLRNHARRIEFLSEQVAVIRPEFRRIRANDLEMDDRLSHGQSFLDYALQVIQLPETCNVGRGRTSTKSDRARLSVYDPAALPKRETYLTVKRCSVLKVAGVP
jgi:hypothetical protein